MNDLISRQAAIDAIYGCYIGGKEAIKKAPINDMYADGLEEAVDAVWDMPSVTPKTEQKAVLGKIRAEIEQLTSRYSISKKRGSMGIVEWSDRLIEESDVLQIIDKYKAESEDNKDGKV